MNYTSLPLVSMESLRALEDSLDGQTVLSRGFVSRYVEMWPQRYTRLRDALSAGRWDEATEAGLSLFSSSVMVGADRLGQMAGDLVELLKQGRQARARDAVEALDRCGNETAAELATRYVQHAA